MSQTIQPHGGTLIDLYVPEGARTAARRRASALPGWDLTPRQTCDLDLLMCGAFSPLTGFMSEADYARVRDEMRLADGTLWPMPITLDVPVELAAKAVAAGGLALRDAEGVTLAILEAPAS